MGTRGLVGIKFTDSEGKQQFHGCYNHFDSYPDGLGKRVVEFVQKVLQHPITIQQMQRNVRNIEWVDDSKKPTKKQINKLVKAGFCVESERLADIQSIGSDNIFVEGASRRTKQRQDWYWTLRDLQGVSTFEAIFQGIPYLIEYVDFIKSSLFCEYAYVIDLDRQVLEFYEGWQCVYGHIFSYVEIIERYDGSTFVSNIYKEKDGTKYAYGPCKKVGEKPFNNLNGWEKFYKDDD